MVNRFVVNRSAPELFPVMCLVTTVNSAGNGAAPCLRPDKDKMIRCRNHMKLFDFLSLIVCALNRI